MNELEGMINGLLSNPEEMKKLMDVAGKILSTENIGSVEKINKPVQQTTPDLGSILSGLIGNSSGTNSAAQQSTPSLDSILSGLMGNSGGTTSASQQTPSLENMLSGLTGASSDQTSAAAPSLDSILSGVNINELTQAAEKLLGGGVLQSLMNGGLNSKSDKKELVEALKPWLSEKRRSRLDKAMMFAKVMRIAGVATAFNKGG